MRRIRRVADIRVARRGLAMGMFLLLSWPVAGPALPNDESRASLLCDLRSERLTAVVVERPFEAGRVMPISSYDDDPFVHDAVVECLSDSGFAHDLDGRPLLSNTRVLMQDEGVVFRATQVTGDVGEQQDLITEEADADLISWSRLEASRN